MDSDGLPIVSPKINYDTVEAISARRLLCFVNHFFVHTSAFLNHFATSCERRLEDVNRRIQKTEAKLGILEAKLSSIPGLDLVTLKPKNSIQNALLETEPNAHKVVITPAPEVDEYVLNDVSEATFASSEVKPCPVGVPAKSHPIYKRYFMMLHMGVPLQAVKLKLQMENPNLDGAILESPDTLIVNLETESDTESDDWN